MARQHLKCPTTYRRSLYIFVLLLYVILTNVTSNYLFIWCYENGFKVTRRLSERCVFMVLFVSIEVME